MSTWTWQGQIQVGTSGQLIIEGTGSPEGSVVAPVGSMYMRIDGGANSSVYIKESGSDNTGWVPLGSAFASPMSGVGDMIQGGSSGVPVRVPAGTPGQVPTIQIDGSVAFQNPTGSAGPTGPAGPAAYLGSVTQLDGYVIQQPGDIGTLQVSTGGTDTFHIGPATSDFYVWVYASNGDLTLSTTDTNGFLPNDTPTYTVAAGSTVLLLADQSTDPFWGGGWFTLQYQIPASPATPEVQGLTSISVTGTTNIVAADHRKLFVISGGAGIDATLQLPLISSVTSTHPDFRIWVAVNSGVALIQPHSGQQFTTNIPGPIGATGTTKPYPITGVAQIGLTSYGQWFVTGPTVNDWMPINTQTGASYTINLSDLNGLIRMNNASANTVTVPAESTAFFPLGTSVNVRQIGAGQTTIAGAGGVTINTPSTLNLRVQNSTVQLVKVGTDVWDLIGDVA